LTGAVISQYCPIIDEKEGEGAVTGKLVMKLPEKIANTNVLGKNPKLKLSGFERQS
jgi:hypothetical protein